KDGTPNLLVRASDVMFRAQPTASPAVSGGTGQAVTLSVDAITAGTPMYQWYSGGYRDEHDLALNTAVTTDPSTDNSTTVHPAGTSYYFARVTGSCTIAGTKIANNSRVIRVVVNRTLAFDAGSTPTASPQQQIGATLLPITLTAPHVV